MIVTLPNTNRVTKTYCCRSHMFYEVVLETSGIKVLKFLILYQFRKIISDVSDENDHFRNQLIENYYKRENSYLIFNLEKTEISSTNVRISRRLPKR